MDEEKLLSVIVPVYNVESYLKECLESIISQNYNSLEILLIDDGSTDSSGEICDLYSLIDKRIKVIHQRNAGAGAAKNVGLKNATGHYLTFVDADDTLEENAFSYMIKQMEANDVDVIQTSFNNFYIDKKEKHETYEKNDILYVEEYLKRFTSDWTSALLWNKIYKRTLFEDIFFEEGRIIDDEFFTYQGILNSRKILMDVTPTYNYRKRKTSVTSMKKNAKRTVLDRLDFIVKRRINICNSFPNLQPIYDFHLANVILWLANNEYVDKQIIKLEKKILIDSLFKGLYKNINIMLIFKIILFIFTPTTKLLVNDFNVGNIYSQDDFFD